MRELPDWEHPTPAMLAAVQMYRRCAERGGMNETTFAEWVIGAHDSLWYLQAANWSDDPPDILRDDLSRQLFQQGMMLIVKIVDLGYDETEGWWPLRKVWPTDMDAQAGLLTLMDTATMLDRMKDVPIWPKKEDRTTVGYATYDVPAFLTVSAGFWVFFSLICGPRWRQGYAAMIAAAKESRRLRFGTERRRR